MKKGINMITLSVSVVVILIITSALSVSILNIKNVSDKTKFISEISLINQEIISYKDKNDKYPEKGAISLNVQELSQEALNQFNGENIVDNNLMLYLIDFEKLGIENRQFGNNKDGKNIDVYVFSKNTNKVYYLKGIEYEGNIYYSLTEDLLEQDTILNLKQNEIKKEDCIFVRKNSNDIISAEEFTSSVVEVDIYIPEKANNINIMYSGYEGNVPYSSETNSDKATYLKYETICETATNYDITINYTLNNINKTVVFKEDKVDIDSPILDLTNMQIVNLISEEGNKTYIIGFGIKDNLSGVKLKKYEYGDVDIDYFSASRGNNITEDRIDVTGITKCTIFVEDNVGNKYKQVINIDTTNT